MRKYIGFLRGINVSGQKLIKMDLLRKALSSLGLGNVVTYIQSGNLVFESDETNPDNEQKKIEKHIKTTFDFDVPVFIRTPEEISKIISSYPFERAVKDENVKVYVAFLSQVPDQAFVETLMSYQNDYEYYHLEGNNLYALCLKNNPNDTPFSNNFIEKILKLKATTRNWNTVNKMLALSQV